MKIFKTIPGMLVSCFFLLLVLLVYGLLPKLRNLIGMVFMAYVFSLFIFFMIRAVLTFTKATMTPEDCKKISPVLYFAALSKFFWLQIMSFDLFWVLRGSRKCRVVNHHGENVKFAWYCLYAWGVPLLIMALTVVADNIDIRQYGLLPPKFSQCFGDRLGALYYLHIPIGIIIGVNTVLFIMTYYSIWLIKRGVNASSESRTTNKYIDNYAMHLRLALMMGISWILEVVEIFTSSSNIVWTILSSYHIFIGVPIFFLFVFNKQCFVGLCIKFNINNRFVRNMKPSEYSKSESELRNLRRSTFKGSKNDRH
ncbi:G-protein coupled receptor Mth2-like [Trichoplusia ni]|uniref:G-protein coupled receptor Mth2-like n=1 Tax=Trichoplusia ni TaxID=7111 RepID=A0A7E5WG24_TRINI|nr:G-protein coupled receptor Mth2-like [Trichoplusia ni]XP_026739372.1 G-protein coupled receptor Mth2-like [Trichoplusia ni]